MTTLAAIDVFESTAILKPNVYVACPFCRVEWSHLRSCKYFPMKGQRPTFTNVCVVCAETVFGLEYLPGIEPISGVEVDIRVLPHMYDISEKRETPSNYYAEIRSGGGLFEVYKDGIHLAIYQGGKGGTKQTFDNIFQVWSFVREKSDGSDKNGGEIGWGSYAKQKTVRK